MNTFKIKLNALPLKLRSLDIYIMNYVLFLLAKKKKFRSTKLVIFLDDVLAGKREQLNQKTEAFMKSTFLSPEA